MADAARAKRDADQARFLVSEAGALALDELAGVADPSSLAVASRLRERFEPEQAAALSAQAVLRRRARSKFGPDADGMLFTSDGLEQATRPTVARWRAERLAAAGARRVIDLGCGLGADSRAFLAAGLEVVAVEQDEATAVLARHNLGQDVLVADAVEVADQLVGEDDVAFCDPARRTDRGRTWDASQFTPPWSFVEQLLRRRAVVKLGPGLPHRMIPDGADTAWISDHGDVVEACVASAGLLGLPRDDSRAVERAVSAAVLLPGGALVPGGRWDVPLLTTVPGPGDLLVEPDGALIRAGAVAGLAERIGAHAIAPDIAYLVGDRPAPRDEGASFRVREVLPWREKDVRAWLRRHDVGTVEIKKRGIDTDPAQLRRRLRPSGSQSVTLIISPTRDGARAFLAERLG